MATPITLLQLSPTMSEGTLVRWLVKEGEKVSSGQAIAEVETDKAVMEQESFDDGTVLKLLVKEGTSVKVGDVIGAIGKPGEDASAVLGGGGAASKPAEKKTEKAAASKEAVKQGAATATQGASSARMTNEQQAETGAAGSGKQYKLADGNTVTDKDLPPKSNFSPKPQPGQAAQSALAKLEGGDFGGGQQGGAPTQGEGNGAKVVASPLARKIAAEHGIDLRQVQGSGPGGRVVRRDIESAVESGSARLGQGAGAGEDREDTAEAAKAKPAGAALGAAAGPVGAEMDVALSGMRKVIARRLVESRQQVPSFSLTVDVDAKPLLDAVAKVREMGLEEKVTVTHFLIKAMASTLMRHEWLRTQWRGDRMVRQDAAHISCAVAVDEGLLTPVIRNASSKGVAQIAKDLRELAELARARKLTEQHLSGGTQTLSNLGMFGIKQFDAIINPPEATILAVGAVEERPVVKNGALEIGKLFTMTLSCDHRVVDGAVGAAYLKDLKAVLEDPLMMLV